MSIFWCPHTDSNRGPTDYKSIAHQTEGINLARLMSAFFRFIYCFYTLHPTFTLTNLRSSPQLCLAERLADHANKKHQM